MDKSSKIIIALLIIILIVVLVLGGYEIYSLNQKVVQQESKITALSEKESYSDKAIQNSNNTLANSKRALTNIELNELEHFFNKDSVNGFIFSENTYTKPIEINLEYVFYYGAGYKNEVTREEFSEYKKISEYYNTDIIKITTEQAKTLYEQHTGEELNNLTERLSNWIYLEQYDAYYTEVSDTIYEKVTCESGTIDESNMIYTVKISNGNTITVQKVENDDIGETDKETYIFKSNVK